MRRKIAHAYDFRVRVISFGNALGNSIVGAIEAPAEQPYLDQHPNFGLDQQYDFLSGNTGIFSGSVGNGADQTIDPVAYAQMQTELSAEEASRGADSAASTTAPSVSVSNAAVANLNAMQAGSTAGLPTDYQLQLPDINLRPGVPYGNAVYDDGVIQTYADPYTSVHLGAPVPITTGVAPDYVQELNWLAAARADDQAFYTSNIDNASNGFTAAINAIGRSLNNAGYDVAQGAVSLYGLATDGKLRAQVATVVGNAITTAVEHPIDTATTVYAAATNYLSNTSTQQLGEDALRVVAGGLATDGLGRLAGLASGAAVSGLEAAGDAFLDGLSGSGMAPAMAAQRGSASLELLVPGASDLLATNSANELSVATAPKSIGQIRFEGPSALPSSEAQLLSQLDQPGASLIVPKDSISMATLRRLSAATPDNVEFAMLTRGPQRMIIRGGQLGDTNVGIWTGEVGTDSFTNAYSLGAQGWRWSGHTHPFSGLVGVGPADSGTLALFREGQVAGGFSPQTQSGIWNLDGNWDTFGP